MGLPLPIAVEGVNTTNLTVLSHHFYVIITTILTLRYDAFIKRLKREFTSKEILICYENVEIIGVRRVMLHEW